MRRLFFWPLILHKDSEHQLHGSQRIFQILNSSENKRFTTKTLNNFNEITEWYTAAKARRCCSPTRLDFDLPWDMKLELRYQ